MTQIKSIRIGRNTLSIFVESKKIKTMTYLYFLICLGTMAAIGSIWNIIAMKREERNSHLNASQG